MPHSSAVCRKQCAENCVSFSTHPRPARTASLGVGVGQNRTRKRRWRWNRVNDSTHFRHALRMTQQRFRSVTRMMYFFFIFFYIHINAVYTYICNTLLPRKRSFYAHRRAFFHFFILYSQPPPSATHPILFRPAAAAAAAADKRHSFNISAADINANVLYSRTHIHILYTCIRISQCVRVCIYNALLVFGIRCARLLSAGRVCIKRYTCPGWGRGGNIYIEKKNKVAFRRHPLRFTAKH